MPNTRKYRDNIDEVTDFFGTLGEFRKVIENLCMEFDEKSIVSLDSYRGMVGFALFPPERK